MEVDLSNLKTYSIGDRKSKVDNSIIASPYRRGNSMTGFINTLPKVLKVNDILSITNAIVKAREMDKPVIAMIGGHVIKTGCSPLLIQLAKDGFITNFASNGAAAIHDVEMAMIGKTSEDVEEQICDGSFGMASETASIINIAAEYAAEENVGFGFAVGGIIGYHKLPYRGISLINHCFTMKIPYTIHVAIGTDIIHQHNNFDAAATGQASYNDFYNFLNTVCSIGDGGVVLNFGSAVIMPEVFLKALSMARNLTGNVKNFVTANFDMIQHYRPNTNVVQRPVITGGKGYSITGHHEIMIPLLTAMIYENS